MEMIPGQGPKFSGIPSAPLPFVKGVSQGPSIHGEPQDRMERSPSAREAETGVSHDASMRQLKSHLQKKKPAEPLTELRKTLFEDLDKGWEALRKLPPAVSFFGSARIDRHDPCFDMARKIGQIMSRYGIPICTGAGPSIMEYVPNGYLEKGVSKPQKNPHMIFYPILDGFSPDAQRDDCRTQGFSIKLPFEEEPNPSIQVKTELKDFAFRKFALIENKRAYGFFPGGFGTQDELFEAWDTSSRQEHKRPMALVDRSFWLPQLRALEQVALRDRPLITKDEMAMAKNRVTDDSSEFISLIGKDRNPTGFQEDPEVIHERLKTDLTRALNIYDSYPEAVTFIGSPRLANDDVTCRIARAVAGDLSKAGIPMRVGDGGSVIEAVAAGARDGNPDAKVDGFLMANDEYPDNLEGLRKASTVQSPLIHKSFIGRKMSALVVLPGGVNTLSELFGVLCMMQTRAIERKPIILVGRDYWTPLISSFKQTMLTDQRKLISPQDLNLFTMTDSPEEIANIIRSGKNSEQA
jgi:predicted Rossmann-fold nucleotide-binding protein